MAISSAMPTLSPATCTYNCPSVCSIGTSVPEQHPSMTATFKHLKSHEMPTTTLMLSGLAVTPAMQTIVIDCVPIVDPQFAPIIGDNAESVMASPEDPQASSPTDSKMIASGKTRPSPTCVFVVHHLAPATHVWSASVQVVAASALTKIEDLLSEDTMTIRRVTSLSSPLASRTHNSPSVASIWTVVPEHHTSMTTMLEHLNLHEMPPAANIPPHLPIAPAMQTIIVNCVTIVNP